MKYKDLNQKKGVAGLEILLSMIAMLFMIGIVVMVFVIASARLKNTDTIKYDESASGIAQNGVTLTDAGTTLTTCNSALNGVLTSIAVINASGGETVNTGNYTFSGCVLTGVGSAEYNGTSVNTTYAYKYSGSAYLTINTTSTSIDDVVDWFPTFIVLGALVVLILLVVLIIINFKRSGVTEGA